MYILVVPLDAEHLITFAAVARHGSLTAAGRALHRSQPALSAQLKRLTGDAGVPLYRRTRYGIELTIAGSQLLPFAEAIVRARDGARRLCADVTAGERGVLRLTASMTAAVYLLPPILASYRATRPALQVDLLTRNSTDAVALLGRGEADLAFVEGPSTVLPEGFERHVVVRDDIVLVVPPGHPLAVAAAPASSDLAAFGFVRRERGSGTREVVDRALAAAGAAPLRAAVEATGIDAVKEGVLHGLGPAFISALAVRREVASGDLVQRRLEAPGFSREISVLHPIPDLCPPATRAFLEHLARAPSRGAGPRPL